MPKKEYISVNPVNGYGEPHGLPVSVESRPGNLKDIHPAITRNLEKICLDLMSGERTASRTTVASLKRPEFLPQIRDGAFFDVLGPAQ